MPDWSNLEGYYYLYFSITLKHLFNLRSLILFQVLWRTYLVVTDLSSPLCHKTTFIHVYPKTIVLTILWICLKSSHVNIDFLYCLQELRHVYNLQELELNYYFVLRGLKPLEMSASCQMRHKIQIYTISFLYITRPNVFKQYSKVILFLVTYNSGLSQ